MATPIINGIIMPAGTSPAIHPLQATAPYPGYWYRTYRNYGERLYRMSLHVSALNAPNNVQHPSNPLSKLSLSPVEPR